MSFWEETMIGDNVALGFEWKSNVELDTIGE